MTLSYVSLILDYYDSRPSLIVQGTAGLAPNTQLVAASEEMIITRAPQVVPFLPAGPSPVVRLLATDNAVLTPPGWEWTISFSGVPGSPAPFSFLLPAG